MQLKAQIRRNWKVVAAVSTVSAIGITGLAVADPGRKSGDLDPINLSERTEITQITEPTTTTIPGVSFGTVDLGNDSPFDDVPTAHSVTPDTPVTPASPTSLNTPSTPASPDTP